MTEASFGGESIEDAVRRMALEEGRKLRDIAARLAGRASAMTVRTYLAKVIKEATADGIPIPMKQTTTRGGFPKLDDQPTVSLTHQSIGAKLNMFRLSVDMNVPAFCTAYGFANHVMLRRMEVGKHDFTLSELQKISNILSTPLSQLMEVPNVCNRRQGSV